MADESATDYTKFTHPQAVNRCKDIFDELERFSNKETLTAEDEVTFAALTAEFDALDEHRKGLERASEMARVKAVREELRSGVQSGKYHLEGGASSSNDYSHDAILEPDSVEDHRFQDPWKLSEMRFGTSPEARAQEFRARAMAAIEKMPATKDKVREAATEILEKFDDDKGSLAQQCLLTSSPAYMRGWSKMARGNQHLLTQDEQRALDDVRKVARNVVATGNKWNGVSSGSVSWSFDSEAAEVSDDTTTFAQPSIDIFTARGFVPISIEAHGDEANVTQEVARLLAFGKDELEASKFALGTGTGEPWGICKALQGTASEINAAADDTFARADVDTIQGSLPARYRANASWLANNLIYNKIRAFDTAGGSAFWANYGMGRPAELLGRPAYEAEAMDGTVTTSGAVSNFILIFGDFSNYVIADRIGMSVEFIPHMFHTSNNRPSGQRGWFAYYRVGADSVNDGAFRLLDVPSAA
jgi:hypothetical protein